MPLRRKLKPPPVPAAEPARKRPGRAPQRREGLPWLALAAMVALWPSRPRPAPCDEAAIQHREPGRGRDAPSPAHIPLLGWRDILWRTAREFRQDRIPRSRAG
ncbi:MAG: hypothetical protein WDM92_11710 [Caulobacteraceae bacterium]